MAKPPLNIPGPLGMTRWRRWLGHFRRRAHPMLALVGEVAPRTVEILLSASILILLSPLLLVRGLWSWHQSGSVLVRKRLIGRYQTPFDRLAFAGTGPFCSLIVWLNILRGEMSVVGPRPLSPEEAAYVPAADLVRFITRPGLISLFGVRSRIGLAHGAESAMDRELYYSQTLGGDLGLAARSVVSSVLGGGAPPVMPPILNFFGVPIVNTTMDEAVEWVVTEAVGKKKRLMAFVNPDCLNISWGNAEYRSVLQAAERVLPDGIGIHLGCRMLGQALRANVNGTDMFPLLCEAAAGSGLPIYLLGARPGIARAAADSMIERYPGLLIAGARDGYFEPTEEAAVIEAINDSGARILLVAFGAPRQELWLRRWRDQLAPPVAMGVGGLFDFYSGRIQRAPLWMREMGLEWLFRLMQEPGRMWRRYVIGNPLFLWRVRQQARQPDRFPLPVDMQGRNTIAEAEEKVI